MQKKISITLDASVRNFCPDLVLNVLQCKVCVLVENDALWSLISNTVNIYQSCLKLDEISSIPAIQKARQTYKILGKDPSRYRPSAESLLRRIALGKGLYKVNNAIDILNFISIRSGISIGGYDLDKIKGDIKMVVGKNNNNYNAIGRGILNIDNLPVLSDFSDFFGNPTSDSERTSVTENTKSFVMVFYNFEGSENIQQWLVESRNLLAQYADAKDFFEFRFN
jgi:DNA/RNA-binding domain of Phe-tRNA-synthetase-like protein